MLLQKMLLIVAVFCEHRTRTCSSRLDRTTASNGIQMPPHTNPKWYHANAEVQTPRSTGSRTKTASNGRRMPPNTNLGWQHTYMDGMRLTRDTGSPTTTITPRKITTTTAVTEITSHRSLALSSTKQRWQVKFHESQTEMKSEPTVGKNKVRLKTGEIIPYAIFLLARNLDVDNERDNLLNKQNRAKHNLNKKIEEKSLRMNYFRKVLPGHPREYQLHHRVVKDVSSSEQIKQSPKSAHTLKALLPLKDLNTDVGVGFQKYLSPEIFMDKMDGNAHNLNIKLLTADGKNIFKTSWIKFDKPKFRLYSFPLSGNQNKHKFYLQATNSKGQSAVQEFHVMVHNLPHVFNHYIEICTTITLAEYAGKLERRFRLTESIGAYFFPGSRVDDVWVVEIVRGCMKIVFRQLPTMKKCDFAAIKTIQDKLLKNREVNSDFRRVLKGIAHIKSANITLLNECKRDKESEETDDLGWLRDVAPIFILLGVVAVPTVISCIVCKEVRRRQALMRQIQDRRMKEDKEQMLIQAAEYKHECGFDSDSSEEEIQRPRPSSLQQEEEPKFFGFSRIADIMIPEVVMDTVRHGTELLNTLMPQDSLNSDPTNPLSATQRNVSIMASLNPKNKLLDLSQEEELKKQEAKKTGNSATKVEKMVRFMKNPLEIKPLPVNSEKRTSCLKQDKRGKAGEKNELPAQGRQTIIESREEITEGRQDIADTRGSINAARSSIDGENLTIGKSSRFSIANVLPSIRSILKTAKADDRDVTDSIGSSLGRKFGILINSSSSFSSNTTTQTTLSSISKTASNCLLVNIQEEAIEKCPVMSKEQFFTSDVTSNSKERGMGYSSREEMMASNEMYIPLREILTPDFTNYRDTAPMQDQDHEFNKTKHIMTKDRPNSKQEIRQDLLDKIVDSGKRFFKVKQEKKDEESRYTKRAAQHASSACHDFEGRINPHRCMLDERITTTSFSNYKQSEKICNLPEFMEMNDASYEESQVYSLNYGISDNLQGDYSRTTETMAVRETDDQRFQAGSESSARHSKIVDFDENGQLCFVNMPVEQLTEELDSSYFTRVCSNHNPQQLDDVLRTGNGRVIPDLGEDICSGLGYEGTEDFPREEVEEIDIEDTTYDIVDIEIDEIADDAEDIGFNNITDGIEGIGIEYRAPCQGLQHYDPTNGLWYQSSEDHDIVQSEQVDEINENATNSQDYRYKEVDSDTVRMQEYRGTAVGVYDNFGDSPRCGQRVDENTDWHDPESGQRDFDIKFAEKPRRKTAFGFGNNKPNDIPLQNFQEDPTGQVMGMQQGGYNSFFDETSYNNLVYEPPCGMDYGDETFIKKSISKFGRGGYSDDQQRYIIQDDQPRRQERNKDLKEIEERMDRCGFATDEEIQLGHFFGDQSYHQEYFSPIERSSGDNFCEGETQERMRYRYQVDNAYGGYSRDVSPHEPLMGVDLGDNCYSRHHQDHRDIFPRSRTNSHQSSFGSPGRPVSLDSPCQSDHDSAERSSLSSESRKERRKSFLARQYRVEIPEQTALKVEPLTSPKMQLNPMFVIEEGQNVETSDDRENPERGNPDGDIDVVVTKRKKSQEKKHRKFSEARKPPYGDSFSSKETEQILQQDAAIMEQQMQNYLRMHYNQLNLETEGGHQILQHKRVEQICGKRDDQAGKRTGIRRFSTPSMESWTSTPEKYYYDATGDNSISEEDNARDASRNDKQNKTFGQGRAREYTTRLLKGVSPKIRRHSTSVMGQQPPNFSSTGSNSGTFLGKIGEGKLVQTIQTKFGRKESRSEEPKSPKVRERDRTIDEEKAKGSPLNAIRHKLYLLSGGK